MLHYKYWLTLDLCQKLGIKHYFSEHMENKIKKIVFNIAIIILFQDIRYILLKS